jgi:ubiquinone/menaquinone biosynthesis C-methylase UbiE
MDARERATGVEGWWEAHAVEAPGVIVNFLGDAGLDLKDRAVADLGSGDGVISASLAAHAARVVGFDVEPTDPALLARLAAEHGMDLSALDLEFRPASTEQLPAATEEFDMAVSWSVVEHVSDLESFFAEAWRIVKPDGHMFVQTWPLWFSEHGHHCPHWIKPHDHLRFSRTELIERLETADEVYLPLEWGGSSITTVSDYLRVSGVSRAGWIDMVMESYDSCNHATLGDIQAAMTAAGWEIAKIRLMTGPVHLPQGVQAPATDLAIAGVEMIGRKRS